MCKLLWNCRWVREKMTGFVCPNEVLSGFSIQDSAAVLLIWIFSFQIKSCSVYPTNSGPAHKCDPKSVIIMPAEALAPDGARPSEDTVLTTKLDMIFQSFFGYRFRIYFRCSGDERRQSNTVSHWLGANLESALDIIQHDRQNPAKSRSTSESQPISP